MLKSIIFPLILILSACNTKDLVELPSSDNDEPNKKILSEFAGMDIGSDFKVLSKNGEISQVENTDVIDNCMYAENKKRNIDYLVFDNNISTATYSDSVFLGMNSLELKSKISNLKLIKNEYDENTYYLQNNLDQYHGVKFYVVDDKVIEVTYGLLDKLQYQEGCS